MHRACGLCARAEIKRDTGYYPDTPLSLNHALMKGQPLRAEVATPPNLPQVGAFASKTFGTMQHLGMKKGMRDYDDEKAASVF